MTISQLYAIIILRYESKKYERRRYPVGEIIQVDFQSSNTLVTQITQTISLEKLRSSRRKLSDGLILPAEDLVEVQHVQDHTADPIKKLEDIQRISNWYKQQERYRDNMLFIVGINFGLRVSDLLRLRFCDLIDEDFTFKPSFLILEKKTQNTRKKRKNRYVAINDAVVDAVTLYLQHNTCRMDDYLFRSESNHGKNQNKAMSKMSVERILKAAATACGLDMKMSTHSLRKTFGYHQMLMSGNSSRKLLVLQKIFGHSTCEQTLDYIGITAEEIELAYLEMNLGGSGCYAQNSMIGEISEAG